MATKTKVLNLLKKQGAKWEFENSYTFSAWLPEEYIWGNGSGMSLVSQEKYDEETWAQFWDGILAVIDAPVVRA